MKIIITMAGEGSRFRNVGMNKPKYVIIAKDRTLFEWALLSLRNFFSFEFIFITRKEHESNDFIKEKCNSMGIKNYDIKQLNYLTKGQAETVVAAEELINDKDEITIYNIDTYVEPDQLKAKDIKGHGWIPSFKAEGMHWSFVKFDENKRVEEIAEKVKISEFATIGLYYFASYRLFKECHMKHNFNHKEHYIAPIYAQLIRNKSKSVYTHIIRTEFVHALGTPRELELFDAKFLTKNETVE